MLAGEQVSTAALRLFSLILSFYDMKTFLSLAVSATFLLTACVAEPRLVPDNPPQDMRHITWTNNAVKVNELSTEVGKMTSSLKQP